MDNAILTRYLYFLDEAKYSLLHSLIKKTSFNEVVYWVGEIYHSGFVSDLWEILWDYYYRYLSIKYKKYEKILIKKYNNSAGGVSPIIECFNLIYYLKNIDYEIYFREKEKLKKIYLPKFDWLNLFDKKYHQFILSIHYKNYQNIRWYLQREISYEIIKKYFELMLNYELNPLDLEAHPYKNTKVILYALIKYLSDNNDNDNKVKIKRIPKEIYENLNLQNKNIREKSEDYKFLGRKRKYYIHDDIGKYPLARNNYKNYKELYWYNWLYYAYRSPIWYRRINKYNIEIDDKNREIIFKNEDEYDEFTEKYDYEPDEQTQETQDKSLLILSK
tara:strand:- start:167 stop:1159 length:993 start_codon:yes stop_codon:yes gene_type:complete